MLQEAILAIVLLTGDVDYLMVEQLRMQEMDFSQVQEGVANGNYN